MGGRLRSSEIAIRRAPGLDGVHWKLFADLKEHAGTDEVTVEDAETVGEALDALLADRDALRARVLDEEGDVVRDVNVLVNGTDVRQTDAGFDERIDEGDELALFPPVSGG